MNIKPRILGLHAAVLMVIWVQIVGSVWRSRGLFDWIGVDYAIFSSGTRLMFSERPLEVYDLEAVTRTIEPFSAYYGPAADSLKVGPLPHPAVSLLLYAPFAWLPPVPGYLTWLAVNLALAVFTVGSMARRFGNGRWAVTALSMTYLPLVYALFVGQPVVVMLFALAQAYRAWEAGRDFEAGCWLAGVSLKVQYPVVLILVLAYKRRWRSLAGLAATGSLVVAISLAAFGVGGVSAYLQTVRSMSEFRDVREIVYPHQMISWRGLLVNVLPYAVSDSAGKSLTLVLSALTVATLLLVWRGPWEASGPRFALRMLATMLVTMLTSFHNHLHGATLLLVPALAVMAQRGGTPMVSRLIVAGLYTPTILMGLTCRPELVAIVFTALMAATLGVLLADELGPGGEALVLEPPQRLPRGHPRRASLAR